MFSILVDAQPIHLFDPMKRYCSALLVCIVGSFLAVFPVLAQENDTARPPNIVWIVAEDLGPYIPAFGDSTIETPNLSRLAAEGVRYTHVFSPSGVCAPSRAALATGMYQNAIGAQHMRTGGNAKFLPEGVVPYEALPAAGVKMHSEYMRMLGYYATNNAKEDYQFKKTLTAWDESSNNAHWKHRPDPDQPFFAIFNLGVTHESQIWARAEDSLWVDADLDVPIPPYYPDTDVVRTDIRRMYSNIKIMDQQVGGILAELEAAGELENTVIFWYADHGGPLPRMKRLLYDSGMRVPIDHPFSQPGAGRRSRRPVDQLYRLQTDHFITGRDGAAGLS